MKKKICMILLGVSMGLSLVACNSDSTNNNESKNVESNSDDKCEYCGLKAKCSICDKDATVCGYQLGGASHFCDADWKVYEKSAGENDSAVKKYHEIYGR